MITTTEFMIVTILLSLLVLTSLYNTILASRHTKKSKTPIFTFNSEINKSYEDWLLRALKMYMVKYIEEYTGKNMLKDSEIRIDSEFVINGTTEVGKNIIKAIPRYYRIYMSNFYGEDMLVDSIYELVRQTFTAYISDERHKRLSGKIPSSTKQSE